MKDYPTLHKFPADSTNRDYDIFEELPDGKKIWRACVIGMDNVELKLEELARESANKFLALSEEGGKSYLSNYERKLRDAAK